MNDSWNLRCLLSQNEIGEFPTQLDLSRSQRVQYQELTLILNADGIVRHRSLP